MSAAKQYEVKFLLTKWNNDRIPPHEELSETVRAYTAEDATYQACIRILRRRPDADIKEPHGSLKPISVEPAKVGGDPLSLEELQATIRIPEVREHIDSACLQTQRCALICAASVLRHRAEKLKKPGCGYGAFEQAKLYEHVAHVLDIDFISKDDPRKWGDW